MSELVTVVVGLELKHVPLGAHYDCVPMYTPSRPIPFVCMDGTTAAGYLPEQTVAEIEYCPVIETRLANGYGETERLFIAHTKEISKFLLNPLELTHKRAKKAEAELSAREYEHVRMKARIKSATFWQRIKYVFRPATMLVSDDTGEK